MIPIEQLLAAGVHFGHRVNKWNPKMAPYIFGERNGVHIIDLIQTLGYLENAYQFLTTYKTSGYKSSETSGSLSLGKKVLFVGTKKQVAPIIQKEAESCNANFVNHRWLGGLLTNWTTIQLCVAKLHRLEGPSPLSSPPADQSSGGEKRFTAFFENDPSITKKEKAILKKQYEKLKKFFGGIQNMADIPEIVIIVGQDCEMNAVRECQKLCETSYQRLASGEIRENKFGSSETSKRSETLSRRASFTPLPRTITILDTNSDPSLADIFIPANDDSTKSVELILGKLSEAIGRR